MFRNVGLNILTIYHDLFAKSLQNLFELKIMFCMWIWSSKAKAALPNCVCRREHNFFHTSVSSSQPDNRHPLLPNIKRIFSPFFSSYVWHFWQIGTIFFNHPWHTSHRKTYVLHQIKPIISFLLSFVSLYTPIHPFQYPRLMCIHSSVTNLIAFTESISNKKRISSWYITITMKLKLQGQTNVVHWLDRGTSQRRLAFMKY